MGKRWGCQAPPMPDLIDEWFAARTEWDAANESGQPVHVRNRIMDRIRALSRDIASHPEMHDRITALCAPQQMPDVRLSAALVREHWDATGAADTLVSIIHDSGASIARPVTMSSALSVDTSRTAWTAALCLFNIDSGRSNT